MRFGRRIRPRGPFAKAPSRRRDRPGAGALRAGLAAALGVGCGPAPGGPVPAGPPTLEVEPAVVRIVGAETATVTLRAPGPLRLDGALEAPGVEGVGPPPSGPWRVGPVPRTARFRLAPEVRGYVEGIWRLREPGGPAAVTVPIRASPHRAARVRPVGGPHLDVGRTSLNAEVAWQLRNEGGTAADLRIYVVEGPARRVGPALRILPALTSTTVLVQLMVDAPGPFEVRGRVATGTSTLNLRLTGEAVAPRLQVEPADLWFPDVVVGGRADLDVRIANVGGGLLPIYDVELSPGAEEAFRWRAFDDLGPAPWPLTEQPLRGRVTFAPLAPGPYARELRVHHSDGVTSVLLTGRGVSCAEACDVPFARPGCVHGECVIERCEAGYHDVNGRLDDGCECGDLRDAGDRCETAIHLGRIEEEGGARAVEGRVPHVNDVDLIRFHADDGFHVFRERFDVRVELRSDDPDLELCVFRRATDEPRPECVLSSPTCPESRRYRFEGRYGREDAADFVVRVRAKGVASGRSCTPYRLIVRNG